MAQYVDIMTDAGFKAVFQDKQVTIKFLNAALAGERQIKDITYLDKEIKPEIVENRTIYSTCSARTCPGPSSS